MYEVINLNRRVDNGTTTLTPITANDEPRITRTKAAADHNNGMGISDNDDLFVMDASDTQEATNVSSEPLVASSICCGDLSKHWKMIL